MSYRKSYKKREPQRKANKTDETKSEPSKQKAAVLSAVRSGPSRKTLVLAKAAGIPRNLNPIQYTQVQSQVSKAFEKDASWRSTEYTFVATPTWAGSSYYSFNKKLSKGLSYFQQMQGSKLKIKWILVRYTIIGGYVSGHQYDWPTSQKAAVALLQMKTQGAFPNLPFIVNGAGTTQCPLGHKQTGLLAQCKTLQEDLVRVDQESGGMKTNEIFISGNRLAPVCFDDSKDPDADDAPISGGLCLYVGPSTDGVTPAESIRIRVSMWTAFSC